MDFSKYIFRASELGKIIGASGKLTDGNKTYLKEIFTSAINGTRKQIQSKYFEKGLFAEKSGINLLNKVIPTFIDSVKNTERKTNEFITGEIDTEKESILYDVKNAWDIYTFDKADLTHEYKLQLKGYLWLWEAQQARLFYCLNNTPEHILSSEARKLFYAGNYVTEESPEYIEDYHELIKQHTHDFKPLEERFKIWDVYLEDCDIENMKSGITSAREYLNTLWEKREEQIKYNRSLMSSAFIATHDNDTNATIIEKI
jgi:hypothetical protein